MFGPFVANISFYLDYLLLDMTFDIYKLVSVIDLRVYLEEDVVLSKQHLYEVFCEILHTKSIFIKFFLLLNCLVVKLLFFQITPITFWIIPVFHMFLVGIILLFFIKPIGLNQQIWYWGKYNIVAVFVYQFCLTLVYISFMQSGTLLKVGLLGLYNLPFNLSLAKLVSFCLVILLLYLTINFYLNSYLKILLIIKPELCIVIFFLGFSAGMIFLQNDLFSLFLYFEILSFCIYGLLFFQKWTNTQLHSLIRYVLFSLWVSTCYIVGIAFYLASYNFDTSLSNFATSKTIIPGFLSTQISDMFMDFDLLFAITFFLIYFLFKLGVGPFYTWTIEVYNSCPTGVLLPISLIPKLVYFPMLFFMLFYNFIEFYAYWSNLLLGLAIFTIFIGSFGILITDKLKEIYAWSSIIHTGNLLIIVSCISTISFTFLIFYLISYCLISIGFIVLITSLRNTTTGRFVKTINELNSLHYLHSTFCFSMTILLASAAGFTPFISFFMKFSVLSLLSSHYGLLITLVVGLLNIIGSVAYLRMLRNIVSFNLNSFSIKSRDNKTPILELDIDYFSSLILNLIIVLIIFSFFFFKTLLSFLSFPFAACFL